MKDFNTQGYSDQPSKTSSEYPHDNGSLQNIVKLPCNYYKVCASMSTFPHGKPNGIDCAIIRKELGSDKARRECTIEQVQQLLEEGRTLLFGDFQGGTRECHWRSQRLFAVDIDNDEKMKSRGFDILEPDDAVRIALDNDLDVKLLYFTKSTKVKPWKPRYRIVVDAGKLYTDPDEAKAFMKHLCEIYPEADACSTRLAQMYHSGKGIWPLYREDKEDLYSIHFDKP